MVLEKKSSDVTTSEPYRLNRLSECVWWLLKWQFYVFLRRCGVPEFQVSWLFFLCSSAAVVNVYMGLMYRSANSYRYLTVQWLVDGSWLADDRLVKIATDWWLAVVRPDSSQPLNGRSSTTVQSEDGYPYDDCTGFAVIDVSTTF